MPKQSQPLVFPIKGLYESTGFDIQPPGTTNDALNVRAFCALAGRARGGRRSGTSKYTYDPVTSARLPIQDMVKAVRGVAYTPESITTTEDFQSYTPGVGPDLSPLWGFVRSAGALGDAEVNPSGWEAGATGVAWRDPPAGSSGWLADWLVVSNDTEDRADITFAAKTFVSNLSVNEGLGTVDEPTGFSVAIRTSPDMRSGYMATLRVGSSINNDEILLDVARINFEDNVGTGRTTSLGSSIISGGDIRLDSQTASILGNAKLSVWVESESSDKVEVRARLEWPGAGREGAVNGMGGTIVDIDSTVGGFDGEGTAVGLTHIKRGGTAIGLRSRSFVISVNDPTFTPGTAFRTIQNATVFPRNRHDRPIVKEWNITEAGANQYYRPEGLATVEFDGTDYSVLPSDGYDLNVLDEMVVDTVADEFISSFIIGQDQGVALTRPDDTGESPDLEAIIRIPSGMQVVDEGQIQFWLRVDPATNYAIVISVFITIDEIESAANGTGKIRTIGLSSTGSGGTVVFTGQTNTPVPVLTGDTLRVQDAGDSINIYLNDREVGVFTLPLESSPGSQLNKFTATDAASGDKFGSSIASDGSTVIIGAPSAQPEGQDSGSAYLFDPLTGAQLFKLVRGDGFTDHFFGGSVAVGSTVAVVGAYADDDIDFEAGAVYLFDVPTGVQTQKLQSNDLQFLHQLGWSVGIQDDFVVAGAPGENDEGAVYTFSASSGLQLFKMKATDAASFDGFGTSVAVADGVVAIGAPFKTGTGSNSGAVYLFDLLTGVQLFKLTASDAAASDEFGSSVDINNGIVAVGSPGDDDVGSSSGSVYLFNAATGVQTQKVNSVDGIAGDRFGTSVGLTSDTLVVGSPQDDDLGQDSGAMYLFDLTTVAQTAKILPTGGAAFDNFGGAVAIDATAVYAGSQFHDIPATNTGAAYNFTTAAATIEAPSAADGAYSVIAQGEAGSAAGTFVSYVSEMRWVRSGGAGFNAIAAVTEGRLLAVSNGDVVDVTGGEPVQIVTGIGALNPGRFNIQSTSAFNSVFYTDGDVIKEYSLATGVVDTPVPTDGLFPVSPRLVALYRGRLVWSGTPDDAHNWFMSAVGNPLDYNYSPPTPSETQAVAGNNSIAGLIGDVINALIPFNDDYLIFGCDSSIWQMSGDPAAGGVIDLISDQTGMAFGSAWAKDPANTLYFWGNDGVYRLRQGETPQNMTKNRIDFRLRDVALDENRIIMAWNYLDAELVILIQPADPLNAVRVIVWESRTDAWWEDSYPQAHGPNSMLAYDSTSANDQVFLFGGSDGFIRNIDTNAADDNGEPIRSYIRFAPFIAPSRTQTVVMNSIYPVLAKGSSTTTINIYTGQTAEGCMTAVTPRASIALSHAGRNALIRRKIRGYAVQIEIAQTGSFPWALESLVSEFDASGIPVRHARVGSEGATGGS